MYKFVNLSFVSNNHKSFKDSTLALKDYKPEPFLSEEERRKMEYGRLPSFLKKKISYDNFKVRPLPEYSGRDRRRFTILNIIKNFSGEKRSDSNLGPSFNLKRFLFCGKKSLLYFFFIYLFFIMSFSKILYQDGLVHSNNIVKMDFFNLNPFSKENFKLVKIVLNSVMLPTNWVYNRLRCFFSFRDQFMVGLDFYCKLFSIYKIFSLRILYFFFFFFNFNNSYIILSFYRLFFKNLLNSQLFQKERGNNNVYFYEMDSRKESFKEIVLMAKNIFNFNYYEEKGKE